MNPRISEVIDLAVSRMPHDPAPGKRDRRREVAMRALKSLIAKGLVVVHGDRVGAPGHPGYEDNAQ